MHQTKAPTAITDFVIDWAAYLDPGDTILESTWDTGGLDQPYADSVIDNGTRTKVWVGGGVLGKRYVIFNEIVTSSNRTQPTQFDLWIETNYSGANNC